MDNRTLLIVDDEENVIKSLYRTFRGEGYNIITANSGMQALDVLEKNPEIGVILSDQRMPQMTGTEFLAQARKMSPDTVRMVLSGYTDINSITNSINEGAIYKFLTKPWSSELLLAHVKDAFEYFEFKSEKSQLSTELKRINSELEDRVTEQTRDIVLNIHALQTSQDILESLPLTVLGIDEEGLIVMANKEASKNINSNGLSLIGARAQTVLPEDIYSQVEQALRGEAPGRIEVQIGDTQVHSTCCFMAEHSRAKGVVLVLDINSADGRLN